jgi:hypothetical protein
MEDFIKSLPEVAPPEDRRPLDEVAVVRVIFPAPQGHIVQDLGVPAFALQESAKELRKQTIHLALLFREMTASDIGKMMVVNSFNGALTGSAGTFRSVQELHYYVYQWTATQRVIANLVDRRGLEARAQEVLAMHSNPDTQRLLQHIALLRGEQPAGDEQDAQAQA